MSDKKLPPEFEHTDKKDEQPSGQRALTRRDFVRIAGVAGAAAASGLLPRAVSAAPVKPKMDKPTISCFDATAKSITLTVCGGATTGAPAGFSIQWLRKAQYDLEGWGSPEQCAGSFSGNASESRYNLGPSECVNVNIGEFLFDDNGASTNCPIGLECDTEYVFRAFAHANSTYQRSDFTANLVCRTLPCDEGDTNCTVTQGYWKTHGPEGCVTGNNTNQWPVASLTLGTTLYTDLQLCSILNTPASGNGLLILAHQLIAAKLNIASGADPTAVAGAIAAADALIDGMVIPPVGAGFLSPGTTSALNATLTDYNEGDIGPGHCPKEEGV